MKVKTVAWLSAVAMSLTSLSVWSFTDAGAGDPEPLVIASGLIGSQPSIDISGARFESGSTLRVEGRLGHPTLASETTSDTYVYLDIGGSGEAVVARRPPVRLGLVIDRSGSMRGRRLRNALSAARGMVSRLRDGDRVSVVTYNARSEVLVRDRFIDGPAARRDVLSRLDEITAGGETCISCGIEDAMRVLDGFSDGPKRMILLSDGEATAGVRNLAGFERLAERSRAMGCAISTVGVDVGYNERVMSRLAAASNGRHYFAENPSQLSALFEQELQSLERMVASAAEVRIRLAPGVRLVRMLDRSFRREGDTLVVPLGAFSGTDHKTVLLQVRVDAGADAAHQIAEVSLNYRDLASQRNETDAGRLVAMLSADPDQVSDLDPLVAGRLGRSETAAVLREANSLFDAGRAVEARRHLKRKRAEIGKHHKGARAASPALLRKRVDADFERQLAALDQAEEGFATPPAAAGGAPSPAKARRGKVQVRRNASQANDLAF